MNELNMNPRYKNTLVVLRFTVTTLMLMFGIYVSGLSDPYLGLRGIVVVPIILFSLPLLAQLFSSRHIRWIGIWLGVFLVLQSLMSPILKQPYRTLLPNLNIWIQTDGGGRPGIAGLQHITTDTKGFRVIPPYNYNNKNPEELLIFAVGGSTTESMYIDDRTTWPHLLQKELAYKFKMPVTVINTGVSGSRAANYLSTLKHILPYKPDVVLFLTGVNDWVHDVKSKHSVYPYLFQDSALGLLLHKLHIRARDHFGLEVNDHADLERVNSKKDYILVQKLNVEGNSLKREDVREYHPATVSKEYQATLKEISRVCTENKILCVFITQPSGYSHSASAEYRESFWMTPPFQGYTLDFDSLVWIAELYNGYLLDFSAKNGHPSIDLAAEIEPSFDNMYDDVHYNLNGSKRVANVLSHYLPRIIKSSKNGL